MCPLTFIKVDHEKLDLHISILWLSFKGIEITRSLLWKQAHSISKSCLFELWCLRIILLHLLWTPSAPILLATWATLLGALIILLHGPFALDNVAETAHCDSFHCGWAPSSKHPCPSSLLAVEATDSLSSGVLRLPWHAIPWPSTWPHGMWNHCNHTIPLPPHSSHGWYNPLFLA